jgi:hypothetical protein
MTVAIAVLVLIACAAAGYTITVAVGTIRRARAQIEWSRHCAQRDVLLRRATTSGSDL